LDTFNKFLEFSPEVFEALQLKKPLVALESTIIAHGMPFPQNLETALLLEYEIRLHGATPATIALIEGKIKIGLSLDELEVLAKSGSKVHKTSRRDLAYILMQKKLGATTVAATMIAAEKAGIKIFATGGIGGVHRDATQTMDISADLQELSKTNVAVVCAGVKSILDIGLTLEYLETMGVPVIGFQTDEMPAFYSGKSGFKVDFNLKSSTEIAHFLQVHQQLDLQQGVLITQTVPVEYDIDKNLIDNAIEQALAEQKHKGIRGKESTPFLLAKVKELTGGESLVSNIALVRNNARLAAEIAVKMNSLL